MVIDECILASKEGQQEFFARITAHARLNNAVGLITLIGTWYLFESAEQRRRFREDAGYREAFDRAYAQGGVRGAALAGFGTAFEAITCSPHTKFFAASIRQRYHRVDDHIEPFGEPIIEDSREVPDKFHGRMFPLYEGSAGKVL
jgi:hypothetical protein